MPSADVTENPPAPAVADVLELHPEAVGIREVELRRSVGGSAPVRHPHAHVRDEGRGVGLALRPRPDPVVGQRGQDRLGVVPLHREAEVVDHTGAARSAGAAGEHEELGTAAIDVECGRRGLVHLGAGSEDVAVEGVGTLGIGDVVREVVEVPHGDESRGVRLLHRAAAAPGGSAPAAVARVHEVEDDPVRISE